MCLNDIINEGAEGVSRFDCKSTIKIIHGNNNEDLQIRSFK